MQDRGRSFALLIILSLLLLITILLFLFLKGFLSIPQPHFSLRVWVRVCACARVIACAHPS